MVLTDSYFKAHLTQLLPKEAATFPEAQLQSASLDLRLGLQLYRFKTVNETVTEATPVESSTSVETLQKGEVFSLQPNELILASTLEQIAIPLDCIGLVLAKSGVARLGLSIHQAPFCNPGYTGAFPLQLKNHTPNVIQLRVGLVLAQLVLLPVSGGVDHPYEASRNTYQNDTSPLPKWEKVLQQKRDEVIGKILDTL
jgi:dCTP deaminase